MGDSYNLLLIFNKAIYIIKIWRLKNFWKAMIKNNLATEKMTIESGNKVRAVQVYLVNPAFIKQIGK